MSNEVYCLNLEYDSDNDMLVWTVKYIHDDSIRSYASPAKSFSKAVGIRSDVKKEDWFSFCNKMKGKKMNFVLPEEK
jgi:hypothetical protein